MSSRKKPTAPRNSPPAEAATASPFATVVDRLVQSDPMLAPYAAVMQRRLARVAATERRLTGGRVALCDFAAGHEYFGLHFREGGWVFREWAPNATALYLVGEMNGWRETAAYALARRDAEGVWELRLPAEALGHGTLFRLSIHWPGGHGDRIPAYARRVVQDPKTLIFNAQVWQPAEPYRWQADPPPRPPAPLIYEAHVGMAQETEGVGTYREFTAKTLPRIVAAGYDTLQLMAIQHHPYYGSFGYHVSSFFAASSRFGTPEELKALIDAAHGRGLRVVIDLVHSHAVSNQVEGLSLFDGTLNQYFHEGPRGFHVAWDSRCFDYGKPQVLHFLLSNIRYWLDEYRVDGFRFDGITSMLYLHHGLGRAFTSYDGYFDDSVDEDALAYLALANKVVHGVRPDAVTIAEDVSGMPGLAVAEDDGGCGFDYRFAMGVPDHWIRLIKESRDEDWQLGHLWHELTNRRSDEKTISYAESHDQALVGDQTLIFRLMGAEMYHHMHVGDDHWLVERGIALHKLIRLVTLATAGNGYLNFMGNEFGHPEWIDFPREGNGWSYRYARRQWGLVDAPDLKYRLLDRFDKDMIGLARHFRLLNAPRLALVYTHEDDKLLAFRRAGLLFVFNFHPVNSYRDYRFAAPQGKYRMVLDSDRPEYGGHGRLVPDQEHFTLRSGCEADECDRLSLYLPSRTALVLKILT
ncbi:MAG: alpha amylase C-terminal domain-containing protein [Desulfobacterales bacterium]